MSRPDDDTQYVFVMAGDTVSPAHSTSISSSFSSKAQLIFSKSKVYVHPSANAKDNIPGFIALVRPQGAADKDILLSWIPESVLHASDDYGHYVKVDLDPNTQLPASSSVLVSLPPRSSLSSYAFSVPLRNIYSIQVRPPSLGWWWGSLVVHTRTAQTQPALFFHDGESESTQQQRRNKTKEFDPFGATGSATDLFWGGDHFLKVLGAYAALEKSTLEPSIMLVNPEPEDRLGFSPKGVSSDGGESAASSSQEFLSTTLRNAKWGLLQQLARVTQFSRRAAQNVLDSSPQPVRTLLLNQPEVRKIGDDFEVARVYLAKWALGIAQESEQQARARIVWNESYGNDDDLDSFQLLSSSSSVGLNIERRNPVGKAEWRAFFDHTGRLCITEDEVKERIFHGGLAADVRPEAWLFLVGVYPWDSSADDRRRIVQEKRNHYIRLKRQWWDDTERQASDEFWKDQKSRIEKDVHRTDRNLAIFADSDTPHPDPESRFADMGTNPHLEQLKDILITYNEYNLNLGYVQGMSDLLSPLYVVLQDDALAFWAFCGFMDRMERNFLRDQSGMRAQMLVLNHLLQFMMPSLYDHLHKAESTNLFFFFRMLLVWFKREFEWDDVLRLWEVLWTDLLSSQFHLFVALAMLDKHKDVIMTHLRQFDEILKYMNDLAGVIDLEDTLIRAELLFKRFRRRVDLVDRRRQESSSASSNQDGSSSTLPPAISDDLRGLLSRNMVIVREAPRPANAGGG